MIVCYSNDVFKFDGVFPIDVKTSAVGYKVRIKRGMIDVPVWLFDQLKARGHISIGKREFNGAPIPEISLRVLIQAETIAEAPGL